MGQSSLKGLGLNGFIKKIPLTGPQWSEVVFDDLLSCHLKLLGPESSDTFDWTSLVLGWAKSSLGHFYNICINLNQLFGQPNTCYMINITSRDHNPDQHEVVCASIFHRIVQPLSKESWVARGKLQDGLQNTFDTSVKLMVDILLNKAPLAILECLRNSFQLKKASCGMNQDKVRFTCPESSPLTSLIKTLSTYWTNWWFICVCVGGGGGWRRNTLLNPFKSNQLKINLVSYLALISEVSKN